MRGCAVRYSRTLGTAAPRTTGAAPHHVGARGTGELDALLVTHIECYARRAFSGSIRTAIARILAVLRVSLTGGKRKHNHRNETQQSESHLLPSHKKSGPHRADVVELFFLSRIYCSGLMLAALIIGTHFSISAL